jgi:hypothetical protein
MFGSPILDVVIGLILVFLLLSLICSAIREGIASMSGVRAKMLHDGIIEVLRNDRKLVQDFYSHPQISSLYRGEYKDPGSASKVLSLMKNNLPSYIPARSFAMTLLDMAARGRNSASALQAGPEAEVLTPNTVRQNIGNLGNPFVQRLVLTAIDTSGNDLDKARTALEKWYDGAMDRVSGWYKRRTQAVLFAIGIVVTIVMDVDAVKIGRQLYSDPAKRDAAVAMAEGLVRDTARNTSASTAALAQTAYARLDSLGLPLAWDIKGVNGWPDDGEQWGRVGAHIWASLVGWLLTAFAISFGAPFWFDTLNKIMVIRSTVKPGEKSPEEGSEDRQPKVPREAPTGGTTVTVNAPAQGGQLPAAQQRRVAVAGNGGDPDFQSHEWTSGRPDGGII